MFISIQNSSKFWKGSIETISALEIFSQSGIHYQQLAFGTQPKDHPVCKHVFGIPHENIYQNKSQTPTKTTMTKEKDK